ncbi:uncharacterized protein LOC131005403 [Salvia miltiorrhiza]|uniref:uncharacterized protein LOC131005403 n=1 Tax=Salvia miltiorrhiza TaxID=226208 RepID=UPI0025ACFD6F|nr:uncharacterized protein LOC131005403 [Salvia miltiorrhiza]
MAGERGRGPNPEEHVPRVIPEHSVEERFRKHNLPTFDGFGDPLDAERWELLKGYSTMLAVGIGRNSHAQFSNSLMRPNFGANRCYRKKKQDEFWNLRQGNMTVTEYDRMFNQLSRYAPHLVDTDEKCAEKALNIEAILPKEKENVSTQAPTQNYGKIKRKWEGGNEGNPGKMKQPWRGTQQQQGQAEGKTSCPTCQKNHYGECKIGSNDCFRCKQPGNFARDCPNNNGNMGMSQPQNLAP